LVKVLKMVLLASGIVTKTNGKILLSRQFVEMSRSRIEGLLTAFTKLITKDKQHTFIETDSVRYVYQSIMDKLYCVLITTKTSNILEDLDTLRLFVRVINEYTSSSSSNQSDEQAILDNAFTLIFAFDEIVALGYKESVNMGQISLFIQMDSHEERVHNAVRQSQEREAKQKMKEKAKQLAKQQRTQNLNKKNANMNNFVVVKSSGDEEKSDVPAVEEKSEVSSYSSKPKTSRALKLGSKSKAQQSTADDLELE